MVYVAQSDVFTLAPCEQARFCESCAISVLDMAAGCPVCRADITTVMCIYSQMSDYAERRWNALTWIRATLNYISLTDVMTPVWMVKMV